MIQFRISRYIQIKQLMSNRLMMKLSNMIEYKRSHHRSTRVGTIVINNNKSWK